MRRFSTTLVAVLAAVALCAFVAAPASAAKWRFETLDGQSNGPDGRIDAPVGTDSSTIVWNNQPHVFYGHFDSSTPNLRHAWWTGTRWNFETLDGDGGSAGRLTSKMADFSAIVWGGVPHVFYQDADNGNLRHAWWAGNLWVFEDLDGFTGPNGRLNRSVGAGAMATVWNNEPHVFYFDANGQDMRHAWWNGQAWFFETLDGEGGTDGRTTANVFPHTALTWGGLPHVFYSDATNGNLRHAWWTGAKWQFETLDGSCSTPLACTLSGKVDGDVGGDASSMVWNNQPHVFYHDASNSNLRHAWWTGTRWAFETLDGAGGPNGRLDGTVGRDTSVVGWRGQPHVFYSDYAGDDQRHGWWNGTGWFFETLDGATNGPDGRIIADIGSRTSSVVVWNTQPHTFSYDATNGDLRHAWYG